MNINRNKNRTARRSKRFRNWHQKRCRGFLNKSREDKVSRGDEASPCEDHPWPRSRCTPFRGIAWSVRNCT
eukprot:1730274-Alexandrium_andersonii.AAC.1